MDVREDEKEKKDENFEMQSLRNVVREGGVDVVTNFEKKFKEIKIEGRRKAVPSLMYSERLLDTYYMETELEAI